MLRGNREHTLVLLVGSRSVLQRHIATAWEALDKETVAGAELRYHVGTLSLNVYPPRAPLATLQPQTLSAS